MFYIVFVIVFIVTGDYSVVTQIGNKKATGTIPSELGLLTNWKHVVFRKLMSLYCLVVF